MELSLIHPRKLHGQRGPSVRFLHDRVHNVVKALLNKNPNPSLDEIRDALVGNLCRCTGYNKIFDSVIAASKSIRKN